ALTRLFSWLDICIYKRWPCMTLADHPFLKERIMSQALTTRPTHAVRNLTLVVLAAWFLFALGGSLLGVFDSGPRPPLLLGLAAVVPVAAFVACYLTSAQFREFVLSLDLRALALAQALRVVGIVFVILYSLGALPGAFALP